MADTLKGLGNALIKRFPFARPGEDFLLEDDGQATTITVWNTEVLGEQPPQATLEQWVQELVNYEVADKKNNLLLFLYQLRSDLYQQKRGLFIDQQHDTAIILKIVLFLFKQLVDDLNAAGVTVSHPLAVNIAEELAEDPTLQDRLFGQAQDLLETNDTLDARTTRVAKDILAATTLPELETIEAGLLAVVQTGV